MLSTARRKTRSTADPYVVEMIGPPHWKWKLTVPLALLAQYGRQTVAQTLAAYGPQPACLQTMALGRGWFVVFSSIGAASAAAAAALRGL